MLILSFVKKEAHIIEPSMLIAQARTQKELLNERLIYISLSPSIYLMECGKLKQLFLGYFDYIVTNL